MKKDKIKTIIAYIVLFIGIYVLSTVSTYMVKYIIDINKSQEVFEDVKDLIKDDDAYNPKEIITTDSGKELELQPRRDYSELYAQNSDFVGWIKVNGTDIDYPVMLTPDNEQFYLHKNFNKQYNYSGVPFLNADADIIRPSDNMIIYGHHMNAGTMFGELDKFKKKEYYDQYSSFTFDTIYRWGTYEIIGIYLTDVNEGCFRYWEVTDCTEEEFNEYVDFIKRKSLYKTDGIDSVEYGDKLVSLSTCAYHVTNGRLVMVGKLVYEETTDLYESLDLDNTEECIEQNTNK